MSIQIDQVRISGFRGLDNVEISLSRVAVLIGPNNSGKTSLIKALQLALGDYSRYIKDEDFHINSAEEGSTEILVDVRIIAVDDNGLRVQKFEDEWTQEFGDGIRAEPNGNQFHALRTIVKPDLIKGGFSIERYIMDTWPDFTTWRHKPTTLKVKFTKRYDLIPFISIDAQRDIHQELNEKSSFVGRVLSSVKYETEDVSKLEAMIEELNDEAVSKSEPLKSLKTHLSQLNQSFGGTGDAEITPFPKKIRDLSKRFSVHFGDTEASSFSMEYHGMGTRSWASMLAVKAFVELMDEKHKEEVEPFFPILAAEEPEAHLHPNAQRSLFEQMANSKGQVIISTHSPYLAAMSDLNCIRALVDSSTGKECRALTSGIGKNDIKTLHREVLRNRGEILFAKALILFEGQTEEQIFPAMFEKYFGVSAFSRGVDLISVGGKNYSPFIKLALSFGIPVFVVSDNDSAKVGITNQLDKIPRDTSLVLDNTTFSIEYLSEGNDIEAELVSVLNLREEIISSLLLLEACTTENTTHLANKKAELDGLADEDLITLIRKNKTHYSGFLADVIRENILNKSREQLVPHALIEAFKKVEEWLQP